VAVPEIVMVPVPVTVVELAVKVNVEVQFGLQCVGEKDAVTPDGRPEAVRAISCAVPETSVTVIVVVVVEL
jgi:hypothetical protein